MGGTGNTYTLSGQDVDGVGHDHELFREKGLGRHVEARATRFLEEVLVSSDEIGDVGLVQASLWFARSAPAPRQRAGNEARDDGEDGEEVHSRLGMDRIE